VFYPLTHGAGWKAPLLIVLLVVSQIAYALGYYGERAQAQREKARALGRMRRPGEARPEMIEAPELVEPQAQPRPLTSA
jgi:hypothetical protein